MSRSYHVLSDTSRALVLTSTHAQFHPVPVPLQSQKQLRILSVRLLFPHSFCSNLCRVSDPQLELQLRRQTLKPSRLSASSIPTRILTVR